MLNTATLDRQTKPQNFCRDTHDQIAPLPVAKQLIADRFPTQLIPRLGGKTTERLAEHFPNWSQCIPELRLARHDWPTLKHCLDRVGRELPLAVVSQVSYGQGMGHPRVGLFRQPHFESECPHTYLYHAAPGRSLKGGQACDYSRIDHVSRKPTLYCFWLLSDSIARTGAAELHQRWQFYRYRESDPFQFDCAKFVTDFVRYLASVGDDPNNPFNYSIPSHTILAPCPSEDRGLYGILKNAHRLPAMMLFVQDSCTYDRVSVEGQQDTHGWVVNGDCAELNVTRQ